MKIRIEIDEALPESEVILRCPRIDENVLALQRAIAASAPPERRIVFYQDNQAFYLPLDDILFFETQDDLVYAHTRDESYRVKHRLYELEDMLPRHFVRASKSAVVNAHQVFSIARNISASSLIRFFRSHKQLYVSRHYYRALRERLDERSRHESE